MDSQKIENLLNLALDTPENMREKSLNLDVGYESATKTWELIVKYNGSLERLTELGIQSEILLAGYAILTVPENLIDTIVAFPEIEYVEKPKRLFFAIQRSKEASCIPQVTLRDPFLTGEGVIVAVIDSGIAYENIAFRNQDGSTRILFLWDQTVAPDETLGRMSPPGYTIGTEFSSEQINSAINASTSAERLRLVPSIDLSGHGTAVAGIAAGSSDGIYSGVAVQSDLIIVKLGLPRSESFPRTTEMMRAITYVVKKAQELGKPVAINLSFGNTYGPHDGSSLLERFLDNASEVGRSVIAVGSGNEGAAGGHVQGSLPVNTTRTGNNPAVTVELAVALYEPTLNVQLWKNYIDTYRIILQSPGGENQIIQLETLGKISIRLENTDILIYIGEPTPYSITQEVYFDFIPVNQYVTSGIWTFTIEGLRVETGDFFLYLPSSNALSSETRFVKATPQVTLTIPSTASKVITVGAYDSLYESYADFSGRGYVLNSMQSPGLVSSTSVKPDIVAPGVDIIAPETGGGFREYTGTSFAVPFVTGSAALLMEWGIVRNNDPFLYGEKVKANLIKSARTIRGENNYPNERVGWGALCVNITNLFN